MKSEVELVFAKHLDELGIAYEREVRFCERRWRLDFFLTEHRIGIEIHGGTWSGGRHVRGAGFAQDCEKVRTATMLGIRILPFTTDDVTSLRAKRFLAEWVTESREREKEGR